MAQIGDLIARLFGGGTRGLSGDADRVLLDDPELEYFNARLRKHAAGEDLVEDPEVIWDGGADGGRLGLRGHLQHSEYGDNLGFTDVLVVLSTDDWHRTLQQLREPWPQRAAQIVGEQLWAHCEQHDLHQIFPQRPFGFRFIEDGGHEMRGSRLGLVRGEFVTGLLPNLYTGPVRASRPVISVLLNIPSEWEGYQEVGRLQSDQVQFTLGTHWLDNFCHPALRAPALYRLQQYADGSFVHIVNPDGKDRYRISSQETEEGPAVLTLSTEDGSALAHMVLAIVDEGPVITTMGESAAAQLGLPEDELTEVAPRPAIRAPAQPTPAAAAEESISPPSEVFTSATRTYGHGGNRTVIPADVDERMLALRERGALFQKVHFARFMAGYDVYLGQGGEIGTTIKDRAATFEIRGRTLALVPHVEGVVVDGRKVHRGDRLQLEGRCVVEVNGQRLEFRDLRGVDADGWPYLGEVRRNGGTSHMVFGGTYRVGRDRRCKVRLPDEPSNENIVWMPEMAQGGTIRSRNGEIPKSRFYTDSIMVASEHAEISLEGEPVLHSQARHCFTYVRRGSDVFALHPTQGRSGPRNLDLQPGDEVLVGNCVFAVDYPPADGPRILPSNPDLAAPRISPDVLARAAISAEGGSLEGAAGGLDTGAEHYLSGPVSGSPTTSGPISGADLPAAHGLGEKGKAPKSLDLPDSGPDSFMGIDPIEPGVARIGAEGMGPDVTNPPPAPRSAVDAPEPRAAPKVTDAAPEDLPGLPPPRDSMPGALPTQDPRVVQVLEDRWQLELSRPAALAIRGWMVSGELNIGNHAEAAVVIPENRSSKEQRFTVTDYFRVFVRGRRGKVELLASDEAALDVGGQQEALTENLEDARLEIIRRAPDGEEDFRVVLAFRDEGRLPDPRARTLAIDDDDPMVRALFTQGLPLRKDRVVQLGDVVTKVHYDGDQATLRDYLGSYQKSDGQFRPFFVHQDGGWGTAPEDGSPIVLSKGDQVLVDGVIFVLR